MAQKDWKNNNKYSDSESTVWSKKNIDVRVDDMRNQPLPDTTKPYSFMSAKVDSKGNYEQIETGWFKTKSQAMAYAKSYMRKN